MARTGQVPALIERDDLDADYPADPHTQRELIIPDCTPRTREEANVDVQSTRTART